MANDKLDNLIKSSFVTERNIAFDESAWDALSDRLDKDRRPSRILPWWWLLGSLILFLLLGLYIFMLSNQLQKALSRIEVLEYRSEIPSPDLVPDSCFENVTFYHYDTVYQTIRIEKVNPTTETVNNSTILQPSPTPNKIDAVKIKELNLTIAPEQFPAFSFLENASPTKPLNHTPFHHPPVLSISKIKKPSKIGLEAGLVYGTDGKPALKTTQFQDSSLLVDRQSAHYIALRLGIRLGPKFQISISPGIEKLNYQTNSAFQPNYYEPALTNYNPSYMSVKQKSWRIPFEIRYSPITNHRFQPFVEAGILAYAKLKAEVSQRYTTELPYIDPFYTLDHHLNQEALRINHAISGLGFIYKISPKISAQLAGQYYFKLKPETLLHMNYSFQGQLVYRF